jgi:hypothetical protein
LPDNNLIIYSLNEFSTIRFLISAIRGQKPTVLDVTPVVPRLAIPIRKLVQILSAKGKVRDLQELVPELIPELDYDQRVHFHNIFAAIEPWQAEYYEFERIRRLIPEYARTYRHVTSLYLSQSLVTLFVLPKLLCKIPGSARIFGLHSDIANVLAVVGKNGADTRIKRSYVPRRLINAFQAVFHLTVAMIWAIYRTRLSIEPAKSIFFAADYIGDTDDDNLIKEMEEGGDILLVTRTRALQKKIKDKGTSHLVCLPTDGFLKPQEAFRLLGRLIKEIILLYKFQSNASPALFYRLIAMPLRRAEYQALFNRYQPQVYWGRDTYDPRHILRRNELHLHGGKSWGVCHSYLTFGTSYPEFRHISFDRYYVLGLGFYELYYRNSWNHDINVVATSSFRASREVFRLRLEEKPDDILVMCSTFIVETGFIDFVRTLAQNFPTRRILLQIKIRFINTKSGQQFINACKHDLQNVFLETGPIYSLFNKARYVFSDPSTAVIEAAQFGSYAFATDVSATRRPDILLKIPSFCVTSGKQASQRIHDIEAKRWQYPVKEISRFIDLRGHFFCDTIRQDINLPEKEKARSTWANK